VELAQFITRNLLFVDHVALMGLEMMGFTRANIDELWIDQSEYKDKLSSAVKILEKSGMNISIYNHQLCLINHDILPYYRKSISDWKNEYEILKSKGDRLRGHLSRTERELYGILQRKYELTRGPGRNSGSGTLNNNNTSWDGTTKQNYRPVYVCSNPNLIGENII
jgi:hypothetical protein